MPTTKSKGGSMSHHYRPASEYDDTTLAQKREYWRLKKREQRARLSVRRGNPTNDNGEKKLSHPTSVGNSRLSRSSAASSCPSQSNAESYKTVDVSPASHSRNAAGDPSVEVTDGQKETWLETAKFNKVSVQLAASPCSISAKAAGGYPVTGKCLTRGAVSKTVVSPAYTRTHVNTCSSVPPVRVPGITNGRSINTTSKPMRDTSVPKAQHKTQVQKLSSTSATTDTIFVFPPCVPASFETEGKALNTPPQSGTKRALVISQRPKGTGKIQVSQLSEEEKAAKRREQWRIKKREQRSKLAARMAKSRDRMQGADVMSRRQTAQKTRIVGDVIPQHLPCQSFLRRAGQKQCPPRVKTTTKTSTLISIKQENDKVRESQRKHQNYGYYSNISWGSAQYKTHRHVQKKQRNMRCKSQLLVSVFDTRNVPRFDPNETPEQTISRRREYWRIKKREQRAKLSMEVKARLKERDSLMRRVKRYQNILEEMRRARVLTQSAGSTPTYAFENIGGFIKEDGTVTVNIPEVPTDPKTEEELHVLSNYSHITKPRHQPDTKQRCLFPICVDQPPPCLAQVNVALDEHSGSESPGLLPVGHMSQLESTPESTIPNSRSPANQTVGQVTLSHPQTTQNAISEGSTAGSNLSGCVKKMSVSSSLPSSLCYGQALTEEERMAKKREYWRIKKREQRAARAARLKQCVLHARANAALQRSRAQTQVAVTSAPAGRRLKSHTQKAQSTPNNRVGAVTHSSVVKQESESTPAAELHSQATQTLSPDIKPSTSPPPPVPHTESDSALNVDSQATSLLAVASMKKLLEESLSAVTEFESQQANIKIESVEEGLETDTKTNVKHLKNELLPNVSSQTLEVKSWQPGTDALVQACSTSSHLKGEPQLTETAAPLSTSDEVFLRPTCEHSSQSPIEDTDGPSSPGLSDRTPCSSELPKRNHFPMDPLQQQQHCEQKHPHSSLPSTKRFGSAAMEHSGLTSLQKKREYWKVMKRKQRAKLRARQTGRHGECNSRPSRKNTQAAGLINIKTARGLNRPSKQALQTKPCTVSLTAVKSIPTIQAVSPKTCKAEQSPDTPDVQLPITGLSCSSVNQLNGMNVRLPQTESDYRGPSANQQQDISKQKWISRSTNVDSAPCLPSLEPPGNPLSSIDLQPNFTLSPIKFPCSQLHPSKLTPISTLGPPKPIPGESEEDFVKRKREYWRIRKKEQRARKAIREKGITLRKASNSWRPILPTQEIQTQDSGPWLSSNQESEHQMSTSLDGEPGSFPYSYTAPIEDESELLCPDYENSNGDEGSVSTSVWRNRYLMDYDPLNQLLVCMVCGEQQYCHSLEGVRAHIDEAHPDTLTMRLKEKQRILEAWDEQVSQRERFFTSQLQQHSGILTEAHRDRDN